MTGPDGLRLVQVGVAEADAFLRYAHEFGVLHDDSYVTQEDLATFDPAVEPAVLAFDGGDAPVGAASVMTAGYESEGLSRFRILHANDPSAYPPLIGAVLERLPAHVERVFLFLPENPGVIGEILGQAGFAECRRAYIMMHSTPSGVAEGELPTETIVRQALPTMAADWANVANMAFRGEPGRYDMTPEHAAELLSRERLIRGGTLLAYRGGMPAGLVMTVLDEENPYGAAIETLAVVPAHQHIGLGRALLREALRAAGADGRSCLTLSVSTTNKRALALYLDAGLSVHDVRVCWQLKRA